MSSHEAATAVASPQGGVDPAPEGPQLHGFDNPQIVDTSEKDAVFLLTTGEGRYLRCNGSAFHLLRMASKGCSMQEIAEQFTRHGNRVVTASEVASAHSELMKRVAGLDQVIDGSVWGLRWPRRLIPSSIVEKVSQALRPAYSWPVALAFMTFVGIAVVSAIMNPELAPHAIGHLVVSNIWSAYALFMLSLIAHEFGHTTACARFGARPKEIGVGIYFIYPALYSDVTDAWRLSRWQRVAVDIGGIYFQSVAGAACVYLYEVTKRAPFLVASLLIATNCLFSLNPILKFDGYWLITDALGVTNLRSDARHVASVLRNRLLRRSEGHLKWSFGVAAAVLVLGTVAAAAWAWFIVRVIPRVVVYLATYPRLLITFARHAGASELSWGSLLDFALSTYFAVVGARMLYGQLSRAWAFLKKTWKARSANSTPQVELGSE